ncbi:MAG: gliding motility-associated C-terminal domain-containing protein [Bacteroidota bacterium]
MNKKIKYLIIYAALILLGKETAFSQNVQSSRKYRVIAYKAGSPEITSMSNETEVIPTMFIYVPNSFTPNGDGLNDTFGISGEAIQKFSMRIFNRWGEMIFETSNTNDQWNGTFKGQKVPMGSYVYKIFASGLTGKRVQKEGTVSLIQ